MLADSAPFSKFLREMIYLLRIKTRHLTRSRELQHGACITVTGTQTSWNGVALV